MQYFFRQAVRSFEQLFKANHWVLFYRRGSRRQCWGRKTRYGKEEQEDISTVGGTKTRLWWQISYIFTTHHYYNHGIVIRTTLRIRIYQEHKHQEHGNIDNTGLSTTREYQEHGINEHGNLENTEKGKYPRNSGNFINTQVSRTVYWYS